MLNGIGMAISKPDLLDRTLIIGIERIPDTERKDEKNVFREFEKARSSILGAIFDHLSGAIHEYDKITVSTLPRMADFARWAMADIGGQGGDPHQFTSDFGANVAEPGKDLAGIFILSAWSLSSAESLCQNKLRKYCCTGSYRCIFSAWQRQRQQQRHFSYYICAGGRPVGPR